MIDLEDLLALLENKALDLEAHADATTSTFFQAVYNGQAAILRKFGAERVADRARLAA